ncbi:MAG: LCP family protein [Faecousia sp.]
MNSTQSRSVHRAILIALCLALLFSGCAAQGQAEQTMSQTTAAATEPALPQGWLSCNGKVYRPRKHLQTILLMGLDKYEQPKESIGYTNKLQSDFLLLLVVDPTLKQCTPLHLNRDTMTEIRRLGIGGGVAGTFTGQLALAHTYGSGGSDSCINAVKAVSKLLGGVTIDHYMTLTMDAVSTINDLVGGVTVTVLDDLTSVDPELVKGAEVTLRGEQALKYVRTRYGLEDSSNLSRMERQRQYLMAFYEKLMERHREDGDFLSKTLLKVSDSFVSDCTVNQLDAFGDFAAQCTLEPIRTIDGEAVVGEEYMEFYPDPDSLQQTILDLFYEEAE